MSVSDSHSPLTRFQALLPFAGMFTHGLGQTLVIATLPPLGREIGLKEVAIGTIISASSLVFFIFSRIWGRVSDRIGRKNVIVIGLAGYAIGTAIFAAMFWLGMHAIIGGTLLWVLIICARMMQSSVMSATGPASSAYIADLTDQTGRTVGMGRLAAAQNIGSILGPGIAGILAALSLLAPLAFASLLAAATAWLIVRYLPATKPTVHTDERETSSLHFRDPRVVRILTLSMIVFTGFAVVQNTLAFRIQDALALSANDTARLFGYAMMISAICSLFSQVVLVQWIGLKPRTLLRIGIPLMATCMLTLTVADSMPAFCLAMGLLGLGLGASGPGFTASTSLAVGAHEQGAIAGLSMAMPAVGFIAGPLIGSGLYQIMPTSPYLFTSALLLGASVYALRSRLHPTTELRAP